MRIIEGLPTCHETACVVHAEINIVKDFIFIFKRSLNRDLDGVGQTEIGRHRSTKFYSVTGSVDDDCLERNVVHVDPKPGVYLLIDEGIAVM